MKSLLLAASLFTTTALADDSFRIPTVAETYQDIESTFGFVPTFMKSLPEAALPGAWIEMKGLQARNTALDVKSKELAGLAVAAQIPCSYCIYFHTQAAKAAGASDAEIQEAIAIAAVTRHWSTFLNGTQADETVFRREVDMMLTRARGN